jgi:hypothetical protein
MFVRRLFRFLPLLILVLAACGPAQKKPEAAPSAGCQAVAVLAGVDRLLAGSIFESHCLVIRGQRVLSVWLVVGELDPAATGPAFENARRLALLSGARLALRVASTIPCVGDLFDAFNPMIVDNRFNCWYRDIIPLVNLPADPRSGDEELLRVVQARDMKYAYRRSLAPHTGAALPSLAAWREFRQSLQSIVSPLGGRRNAAVYPMFVNDYCIVQATWQAESEADLRDEAVTDRMLAVARRFADLRLPVGRLDLTVVDARGRLRVFGKVDGYMLASSGKGGLTRENIIFYHLP